jgi:cAMP-binding proteins - catabolite gene activator and regulatory subunit of cAMP-dependent protein kinases
VREKQANEQPLNPEPVTYTDEKIAFLAHTPIFQHLSSTALLAIARATTSILCQTGHILYYPGQKNNVFFLLKQGEVQIYHLSADGRKLITQTITPGDCFGALPGDFLATSTSFAEATSTSQLYTLPQTDLDDLLAVYPAIGTSFLQALGQRLLTLEAQLVATTFHAATARLASLLLQLARPPLSPLPSSQQADSNNTQMAPQEYIVQGFSHEDLADRLGVYRETVSTSLRELKEAGAIKIGRKRITIHHPERLQDMAQTTGKIHTTHTHTHATSHDFPTP